MKKLLIAACITCALSIAAYAAEGEAKKESEAKKSGPTAEQKAIRKELVEKYDADKNGKLSKEEKAKMTPEDLAKWSSTMPAKKKDAGEAGNEKAKEHKEGDKK